MYDQMFEETRFMLSYAMSRGLDVSPSIPREFYSAKESLNLNDEAPGKLEYERIAHLHQALTKIIAPATPRTVALLGKEREKRPALYFLGSLPILRQFSLLAIAFLIGFIGLAQDGRVGIDPSCTAKLELRYQTSSTHSINGNNHFPAETSSLIDTLPNTSPNTSPRLSKETIDAQCNNLRQGFVNLSGIDLVLVELFLICCAGIGAVFANLYKINRYVGKGIWDDKYHATYWTTLIMGLMSGIVIAELIPIDAAFGKPLVALLGGFAGDLVYNILREIVHRIEAPFVDSNQNVLQAEYDLKGAKQQYDVGHQKMLIALELSALKDKLDQSDDNNVERLHQQIDSIINGILSADTKIFSKD